MSEPKAPKPGKDIPVMPDNRTRPQQVSHRAARRNGDIQRYTIDLAREQRRTLALCAADWEVDKSRIVRTLLFLLESDEALRERVQQELFTDKLEDEE